MASPDSEGEIPDTPLKTSSRSVATATGGPPFQPRGATTVTRPRGLKGTLRPAKAVVRGVRYNLVPEVGSGLTRTWNTAQGGNAAFHATGVSGEDGWSMQHLLVRFKLGYLMKGGC